MEAENKVAVKRHILPQTEVEEAHQFDQLFWGAADYIPCLLTGKLDVAEDLTPFNSHLRT